MDAVAEGSLEVHVDMMVGLVVVVGIDGGERSFGELVVEALAFDTEILFVGLRG